MSVKIVSDHRNHTTGCICIIWRKSLVFYIRLDKSIIPLFSKVDIEDRNY